MTTMRSPDPENIRIRRVEVCQDVMIVTAEAVAGTGISALTSGLMANGGFGCDDSDV